MNLDLRIPLVYNRVENLPPALAESDEILLCFSLDLAQSQIIEPDPGRFTNQMLFIGQKTSENDSSGSNIVILPAGNYLFSQRRGPCSPQNRAEWLDLAIEQQKDGLWERQKLDNKLYVRYLFEDGSQVMQIFRPLG